uniref:hypothetical protein n=1 Tax=Amycolatopsis sp. CA-096443 TaxID=3239919 RepID=UPI003F493E7F
MPAAPIRSSMIGRRVWYRGSVEDAHGLRFVVAGEKHKGGDTVLTLATYAGRTSLRDVRPASVDLVPDGPRHEVRDALRRAQAVQGEFARQHLARTVNQDVDDSVSALHNRIQDLIDRKRPVEAEYWLLQGERFVGAITHAHLQARVDALKIVGDDESWLP